MEQRSNRSSSPVAASNDEMEVAAILLDLPSLIKAQHLNNNINDRVASLSSWGSKRRRSADDKFTQPRVSLSLPLPPPTVKTSPPPPVKEIESKKAAVKGEASSPATPLAFCPSESDDKAQRLKRKLSVKMTKEQLLEIIQDYTQSNELLMKEIKQSRCYYEELKKRNLWLQTRKQELSLGNVKRGKLQIEELETNMGLALEVKTCSIAAINHKTPSIIESKVNKPEMGGSIQYPYAKTMPLIQPRNGLDTINLEEMVNENVMGSNGILDRNKSQGADSFLMKFSHPTFDDETNKSFIKVMAAQARFRRMQICREKNSNSGIKFRFSHR